MEIRIGSGGREIRDDRRASRRSSGSSGHVTKQLNPKQSAVVIVVVLVLFGAAFFFLRGHEVDPSPSKACARWASIRSDFETSRITDATESSMKRVRAYAKGRPDLEDPASDLVRGLRNDRIDSFAVAELTEACRTRS